IAKSNMADMEMDLAGLISKVEDADVSEIITKFAMKEVVLKASYSVASRIGNLTIIDFLR
ncbi:MAG: flagellar biosynthesis protein FlgL, partial [Deltaproteobacteria bacterium]|nr:flagellar biosynthesis protein FlgL [Deltaproteobacteria bacterium]